MKKLTLAVDIIRENIKALYYTPFIELDHDLVRKIKLAVADSKRKKICAYCGDKLRVKDFRTRADKDEYAISGMCQPCMDKGFLEEEELERGKNEH
jgi:RNase P subunit RPR2|tara:strand:- start:343 stop:630 length:288 start_codon:yes stop_codon:yes gene_type:complete